MIFSMSDSNDRHREIPFQKPGMADTAGTAGISRAHTALLVPRPELRRVPPGLLALDSACAKVKVFVYPC
jgi:hypothetical protein